MTRKNSQNRRKSAKTRRDFLINSVGIFGLAQFDSWFDDDDDDDEDWWSFDFGGDLIILDSGVEVDADNPNRLDFGENLNATAKDDSILIQSGSGVFADKDNDGTATLQSESADFDDGAAFNISTIQYDTPQDTLESIADSGSSQTIDVSTAATWDITLTQNCTIDITGATNGVTNSVTLYLRQDDLGGHSVSWDNSIQWDSGSAPSLTTSANNVSILTFMSADGGATWQGFLGGDAFS